MKNILMLFSVALFIVAMFLLYDVHIEYALVAIMSAVACVLASCLIDKEEENLILKQRLSEHALRGTNRMTAITVIR